MQATFTPVILAHTFAAFAAIALGVYYALVRNVRGHKTTMASIYALGLGVAGLFTLLPNRLLGRMLWSSLGVL